MGHATKMMQFKNRKLFNKNTSKTTAIVNGKITGDYNKVLVQSDCLYLCHYIHQFFLSYASPKERWLVT